MRPKDFTVDTTGRGSWTVVGCSLWDRASEVNKDAEIGWRLVARGRLGEAVRGRIARGRANGLDGGWRPTLAKGAGWWRGPAVEEVGPAAVMASPGAGVI